MIRLRILFGKLLRASPRSVSAIRADLQHLATEANDAAATHAASIEAIEMGVARLLEVRHARHLERKAAVALHSTINAIPVSA